jgi:hypothetical protein
MGWLKIFKMERLDCNMDGSKKEKSMLFSIVIMGLALWAFGLNLLLGSSGSFN